LARRTSRSNRRTLVRSLAGALLILAGGPTSPVAASEPHAEASVLSLEEAAALLRVTPEDLEGAVVRGDVPGRRIGTVWRFSRAALLDWLAGAEPPPPLTENDLAVISATGTTAGDSGDGGDGAGTADSTKPEGEGQGGAEGEATTEAGDMHGAEDAIPIGEAPDQPTTEEVFLRTEQVLLAPGEFTLEPGFFYFERQEDVLVFSEGVAIGLAEIDERSFTFDLRTRVGIFDETELLAGISYSDFDSDVDLGGMKIDEYSRDEFGDLRLGVRRTLVHEGVGYPDVVFSVGGRIPVQKGSYGVETAIALVKSIDPAVLFANLSYNHTFSRDFNDVSRLQANDLFAFGLGFAYSLNDAITLSTQVGGIITTKTKFDDATLPQNELFFLDLGLTARLGRSFYLEPNVSFGLNGDENRVVLGLTAPFTFRR